MEQFTEWLAGGRGRLTGLAAECGITHSAVYQWKKIPAEHVRKVSSYTGIEPAVLRPDLFEGMEAAE
jgi:hypothetical protein